MDQAGIIRDLLTWLEGHLDQPLSLDNVAAKAGYSKWHLQRMFKDVTGHAIGAYIRARRLSKSAVALRLTARPILDIALVAKKEDEPRVADALEALGYADRGERSGRHFIREDGMGVRTHTLHLYAQNDDRMIKQIAFRDALRRNPQARDEYMNIKTSLLGGARQDYAPGKTDFITALLSA